MKQDGELDFCIPRGYGKGDGDEAGDGKGCNQLLFHIWHGVGDGYSDGNGTGEGEPEIFYHSESILFTPMNDFVSWLMSRGLDEF